MPRTYKPKAPRIPPRYEAGFLSRLDRRTEVAKSLQANYDAIADDLGGKQELSHVKSSLVERFVFLEATLNRIENDMARKPNDLGDNVGKWIQAVNALTGLAKVLGIDRKFSNAPWISHGPTLEVEVTKEDKS
jgi:hypothetical protein